MRKLVGGAVLIIGVGALGFYANGNHAKRMQVRVTDAASSAVSGTMHDVATEVSGRDIIVSGLAHNTAEREKIVAGLNDLNGRRVVVDQLTVLPIASPYQLTSVKAADGQTYSGQVPNPIVRAMMADDPSGMGKENAATLELASGMPDERWPEVGLMGLSALTPLEYGEMELLDRELRVTGMAATPDEQAEALALIAVLPEGYTSVVEIDTIIPMGMPYEMSSVKGMDGQTYSGMAPDDELLAEMATINGTPEGLSLAWGMPDDTWPDMSSLGLDALNILETGEVSLVDRNLSIMGMAATPVEKAQAEELLANMPEGYSATTDIGTIISMATPYEMHSVKTQASQSFEGMLPSAGELAAMGRFNGTEEGLSLAWGMPDDAWPEVARSGFRALAVLETGEMSLINQTLTVTGTAATPVEQARANALIASLPEEYDTIVNIDTRISMATPYEMHSVKTADGQSYEGVLPDSGKLGALVGEIGTHEGLSLAWGMPDDAWPGVVRQGFSALDPLEYGEMSLVNRRLTVTGTAATPIEQAEAYALVANLPGGYSKIVQIDTLLVPASPYEMTSVKGVDTQTYGGFIPDEATRSSLIGAMGAGTTSLELAYGMPDGEWPMVASKGLAVLDTLETGEMTLVDRVLTVTGVAATPVEKAAAIAVLDNLPAGYDKIVDITSRIPLAEPYELNSVKTTAGQSYQGVLPDTENLDMMAEFVGTQDGLSVAWGMPDSEWPGVARSGLSALGPLEYGGMALVNRELTVTGMAATPIEQAEAIALVGEMPAGYTANVNIGTVLPHASPYMMSSTKGMDEQGYAGVIPDEETRGTMIGAMGTDGAAALDLAFGMPDAAWPGIAQGGIKALGPLEMGEMTLIDRVLTVTGTAGTPAEKEAAINMLADLPEGYSQTVTIDTLDDGNPIAYSITYMAGEAPIVTGKLPIGSTPATLATALGVPTVMGDPVLAGIGGPEAASALHSKLAGFAPWLRDMQELTYSVDGEKLAVFSKLRPGMDSDALSGQWASIIGNDADLVVEAEAIPEPEPVVVPEERDRRYNTVTAQQEIYIGGYWIAITDFSATAENCAATASEVLANAKINFLTGSADLDPSSFRAINSLAAVILGCLEGNANRVEVGGHTDSVGSEDMNQALSLSRAQAVVDTLVARDVPQDRITARGYGESEPIATNDTSDGKAANRRTTIRWIEQ